MSQVQEPNKEFSAEVEENARSGYQAAIALWISEGQQIWTRFNAMLVVNSIIVAAIGIVLTSQRSLLALAIAMPIAGLIVCAVWFFLMKRDFEYQTYLIYSAREIEENFLAPIQTISRGGAFVRGQVVQLTISGSTRERQMSRLVRLLRDRTAAYLVILVFVMLYLVMLFSGLT